MIKDSVEMLEKDAGKVINQQSEPEHELAWDDVIGPHDATTPEAAATPEPLYREGGLSNMDPATILFCCESEKSADALADLGFCATCYKSAGGAVKNPAKWQAFTSDRRVVVIRGSDDGANEAADAIRRTGALVRIVTPPGAQGHGDLSGWLENLRQQEPTIDRTETCKRFQAWALPPALDDASEFYDKPLPEAPEVIEGIIRAGDKMLISGASKAGKSFLMINLGIALAEGQKWLGTFQCRQSRVLYYNFEIRQAGFQRRVNAVYKKLIDRTPSKRQLLIENMRGQNSPLPELIQRIIATAKWEGVGVVLLDPLYKIIKGEENKTEVMQEFFAEMDKIANAGIAVIIVHHFSKASTDRARGAQSSGSGVLQRDPDAGLTLTKLNAPDNDGFMLDFDLRGFRNPDPLPLRWQYPLHTPEPEYASLKVETPADTYKRKATETAQSIDAAELFGDSARLNKMQITERLNVLGIAQRKSQGVLNVLLANGSIVEDTSQKWPQNARWFHLPGKEGIGATEPTTAEQTPAPVEKTAAATGLHEEI